MDMRCCFLWLVSFILHRGVRKSLHLLVDASGSVVAEGRGSAEFAVFSLHLCGFTLAGLYSWTRQAQPSPNGGVPMGLYKARALESELVWSLAVAEITEINRSPHASVSSVAHNRSLSRKHLL